jgi:hypothetical protein
MARNKKSQRITVRCELIDRVTGVVVAVYRFHRYGSTKDAIDGVRGWLESYDCIFSTYRNGIVNFLDNYPHTTCYPGQYMDFPRDIDMVLGWE